MVYQKLSKFLETYDNIPKTGSGLTTAQLKYLVGLDFVKMVKIPTKTGKTPANPNGFILTNFGRETTRRALNKTVSTTEILGSIKKDLVNFSKEVNSVGSVLSNLAQQISQINSRLAEIERDAPTTTSSPSPQVPTKSLISQLKIVQSSARSNERNGVHVSVELFYRYMERNYNMSSSKINQVLHDLFQDNKIDLQIGPDNNGRTVKSPSGRQFQWSKVN